jgi:hypothetical protein
MGLSGEDLGTLGLSLKVEVVEPGFGRALDLSLIDVEAGHVQPGLLLKLTGCGKPHRLQVDLHVAYGTVPVLALQRSLPAAIGNLKKSATDQTKDYDDPKKDRQSVSFLAGPGTWKSEISAS